MKLKMNLRLIKTSLKILSGILVAGLALADGGYEMLIDIETDEISINQMDIDHLEVGDSETIYTQDGKTVDILRTAQGVEIFIDGEKLDPPSLHGIADGAAHEMHKYVLKIECDSEDVDDCAGAHHLADSDHENGYGYAHQGHKVIIIQKTEQSGDEL